MLTLAGTKTIEERGAGLFERRQATASGQCSRSELHGCGQNGFVPWQTSVIT